MKTHNFKALVAGAAVLVLLSACGGSSDAPGPVAEAEVPTSASASPQAYSAFAGSLTADDRGEPLNVDKVTPPTSETAEPADI